MEIDTQIFFNIWCLFAEFSRKSDFPVLTEVIALNAKHGSASISTDGVTCIAGKSTIIDWATVQL